MMDPTMQQYLMYAIAAVIGYLIKHFFPQLPPLPSTPTAVPVVPVAPVAGLGVTLAQIEMLLEKVIQRHLPGAP